MCNYFYNVLKYDLFLKCIQVFTVQATSQSSCLINLFISPWFSHFSAVLSAFSHSRSHLYPSGCSLMRNNHSCTFTHQRRSYSGVEAHCNMYYAGIQWPPYPWRDQCVIGINRSCPVATLDE